MATKKQIEKAISENKEIYWEDPDSISGVDYKINKILFYNDKFGIIAYDNFKSEVEVNLCEVIIKN